MIQTKIALSKALQIYVSSLERRGISDKTTVTNMKWLRVFESFCREKGITFVDDCTRQLLWEYKGYLYNYISKVTQKNLTIRTQFSALDIVLGFFRTLIREEYLEKNITVGFKLPRLPVRISSNYLTQQEIYTFLESIDIKTVFGFYDRTFFEFAYATGVRIKEIIGIKVSDVDTESSLVRINEGKGGHERVVPLTGIALSFLGVFLSDVRMMFTKGVESPYLFPSVNGKKQIDRFSTRRIKKYLELAEINKSVSFHAFRRSLATHILQNGADIRKVQVLLGHQSISTTQQYIWTTTEDLRKVINQCHPMEKKYEKTSTGTKRA